MKSKTWSRVGGVLLAVVISLLVIGLGWFVVQNWTSTPSELRAESRSELAEPYTPTCDGEVMHPGDVCIVYGGGGGGGSYDHYMKLHRDSLTPAALDRQDSYFRIAGYVIMGIGALPYAGGVVVLVSWGLFTAVSLALEAMRGAGRARRWKALAARHGWRYEPRRAGGPSLTGTHGGMAFRVVEGAGGDTTVYRLSLGRPVPAMSVEDHVILPESSAEGWTLLTTRVSDRPETSRARASFHVSDVTLSASRVSDQDVLGDLEGLSALAGELTHAADPKASAVAGPRATWKSPAEKEAEEIQRILAADQRPVRVKEPKPITTYPRRIVGIVIFGLIGWGGILAVRDWSSLGKFFGGVIAFIGVVPCILFTLSLYSATRVRAGRWWWARRHGAVYLRRDPDLVRRLNLPDLEKPSPYADNVVTGTLDGRPFHVFDCLVDDLRQTFVVVELAAKLPYIGEKSSEAGKNLLAEEQVRDYRQRYYQDDFRTSGNRIIANPDGFLSPSGRQLTRQLNRLPALGEFLLATRMASARP
jgi:hypothetical protein